MGSTLGDTSGRREQNLLKVCALIYTEKEVIRNLFLYLIHQRLLIWERCEALTIVFVSIEPALYYCILNHDTYEA
jgi:hypothetical protein